MTIINQQALNNGEQVYDILCPECKGERTLESICSCGGKDPGCIHCFATGSVFELCSECGGAGTLMGLTESEVALYE